MEVEEREEEIYHEKQKLQFCLLHSLNNLFQEKGAFTRAGLNKIAEKLVHNDPTKGIWTPLSVVFRPHHNAFTGNYDVNVLTAAVEERGKSIKWHNQRYRASSIDLDDPADKLMGIVLNIPTRKYGGLWKARHWVALRKINGVWYNLDSDFSSPAVFRDAEEVRDLLDSVTDCGGQILLVMNNKE